MFQEQFRTVCGQFRCRVMWLVQDVHLSPTRTLCWSRNSMHEYRVSLFSLTANLRIASQSLRRQLYRSCPQVDVAFIVGSIPKEIWMHLQRLGQLLTIYKSWYYRIWRALRVDLPSGNIPKSFPHWCRFAHAFIHGQPWRATTQVATVPGLREFFRCARLPWSSEFMLRCTARKDLVVLKNVLLNESLVRST